MAQRVTGVVLLLVASLMAFSIPSGIAVAKQPEGVRGRDPVVVKISRGHVELGADGIVLVPIRTRCQPPLDSFELDVTVRQEATSGSVIIIGRDVLPPCDGRWHRIRVQVPPADDGLFVPGLATVDVFFGAFDPVEGDQEGVDTVTVKL